MTSVWENYWNKFTEQARKDAKQIGKQIGEQRGCIEQLVRMIDQCAVTNHITAQDACKLIGTSYQDYLDAREALAAMAEEDAKAAKAEAAGA